MDPSPFAYAQMAPPPAIAAHVERLWYSEGALDVARERLLPSGRVDVVANLGAAIRLVDGQGVAVLTGAVFSGLLTRPAVLEHPPIHRAVGIRLTARGARRLLGMPLAPCVDRFACLDDVVGPVARELAERCHDARDPRVVLARAAAWAAGRLARETAGDPLVDWVLARIDASPADVSIAALHAASGFSATRFTARFVAEVGVRPKAYARLVRFRRALAGLRPDVSLAALAAEAGYADQPHMNAEFRALADATPRAVLARRYPEGLTLAGE